MISIRLDLYGSIELEVLKILEVRGLQHQSS